MYQIRAPPECWRIHSQTEQPHHFNSIRAIYPRQMYRPLLFLPSGIERSDYMIPDDKFIFNEYGTRRYFDDHEVRLRQVLGQDALRATGGGRHLLYGCPVCKHPWFRAGRGEYPRLTHEQLENLGIVLHADIHAFHQLPRALCPICSTVHLGGIFSVGHYPHHIGYHFLWESASAGCLRLQAMVYRSERLSLDALLHLSPDVLLEPRYTLHSVLAWLETCPVPETIQAYSEKQRQSLACRFPPGNAADGRAQHWQGYAWEAACPPMGGLVLVSLAVTLPPLSPSPFDSLLMSWRALTRAMRMVL